MYNLGNMRSSENYTTATRKEIDRSNEQSEKFQAAEALTRLGMLTKMKDLELYHGRTDDGTPNWHIRADFNNADNATGNRNVNKVPALSTGTKDIALEFAQARDRGRGRAEVYRMKSRNPDARILNQDFDWNSLSSLERDEAAKAVRKTLPSIAEGVDLAFEDRNSGLGTRLHETQFCSGGPFGAYTASEDINAIATNLNVSPRMAEQIGGARNVQLLMAQAPEFMRDVLNAYVDGKDSINILFTGQQHKTNIPISREYIGNWFKNMDIVGAKYPVRSATLGKELDNYLMFELDDVDTEARIEEERIAKQRRMGSIAMKIAQKMNPKRSGIYGLLHRKSPEGDKSQSEIMDLLNNDLYADPHTIVETAKKTQGYDMVLEASAGVWEGFTIQQHTETALQVFEDNYADKLPAKMLPLMRLALLTHDIGKGVAVANEGNKRNQKAYNVAYARDFMEKNNVDNSTLELVLSMISEGMERTTDFSIKAKEGSNVSFYNYCSDTIGKYLGKPATEEETYGFGQMMLALQTCDSAAYTDMATTRSTNSNYRHRNYASFNKSFRRKSGLTGRKLKLERDLEQV